MRAVFALFALFIAGTAQATDTPPLSTVEINRQIEIDHACIRHADAQIATQREIASASGVYDKQVMYFAGLNKVQCRRHINALLACSQRDMCDGLAPLDRAVGADGVYRSTLPRSDAP